MHPEKKGVFTHPKPNNALLNLQIEFGIRDATQYSTTYIAINNTNV